MNNKIPINIKTYESLALKGGSREIDQLMGYLGENQAFSICKMVDYALGLVESEEGQKRLYHYLMNGTNQLQRNYAALWFKRRHIIWPLEEAVENGCIDRAQAFSR